MSDIAIKVESLGKKYKIGRKKSGNLRESLANLFKSRKITPSPDQPINREFWALKDINFEVKQGEAVGIIGRNGAGKSTLLKILSRITKPSTGRFEINGRVSSLLEVGTGFHMELTGRENIYLNGTILGMKRREIKDKFDEIVAFSGVEEFIDTPVKHYSSGMKVRLAFSVAAHLEPEILIIDEVLAVGDAEFQKKCLGKMEDVAGQGRTVLFVSHNMGAVEKLCKKGILLNEGEVLFSGGTSESINKYLNFYDTLVEMPLKSRDDRKGSGKVIITDIKIRDVHGNWIDHVMVGQSIQIVFFYDIVGPFSTIERLNFGIGVHDELGNSIFLHHFRLVQKKISYELLKNGESIVFTIKNLPLVSGMYYLHYSLLEGNKYIDHLDNALKILIIDGNIYNYSEYPPATHGKLLVEGDWHVY